MVIAINNLSTKKSNTLTKNVTTTASIKCYIQKVRDCHILETVFIVLILLLMAASICYYLIKYWARHLLIYVDSINWKWVLKI